jgi:hypothetical protein
VFTDMQDWTDIPRAVLVQGASKRSVCRQYGIAHKTLQKILAHSEPPGYRQQLPRRKTKLQPYLATIEEILAGDREAPRKQHHSARHSARRGYASAPASTAVSSSSPARTANRGGPPTSPVPAGECSRGPASPAVYMICGTPMRPCCCAPACAPRSSRNASGTPTSASPWTSTPTSSRTCRPMPPRGSPRDSEQHWRDRRTPRDATPR